MSPKSNIDRWRAGTSSADLPASQCCETGFRILAARVLLLAPVFLALRCKDAGERSVKDSEGRSFSLVCRKGAPTCNVTQRSGPKSGSAVVALRAEGRLVGVCDGAGPNPHPADCRPLVCEADADCPPLHGAGTESCIGGWCVDPAHEVGAGDSVMLCLAGTGLGHAQPRQVERYALGLNCGTPCVVPSPCRQP